MENPPLFMIMISQPLITLWMGICFIYKNRKFWEPFVPRQDKDYYSVWTHVQALGFTLNDCFLKTSIILLIKIAIWCLCYYVHVAAKHPTVSNAMKLRWMHYPCPVKPITFSQNLHIIKIMIMYDNLTWDNVIFYIKWIET